MHEGDTVRYRRIFSVHCYTTGLAYPLHMHSKSATLNGVGYVRDFYLTQYILCLSPVSLSAIFLCGTYVGESGVVHV